MMLYGIESVDKKKGKKKWILVIIIAILVIALSIFGAIQVANYLNPQKNIAQNEEEKINSTNNQQENEKNNKQKEKANETVGKLTEEQIQAINHIYNSDEKRAFLTFDDGPSYSVTPKILDILKEENVKATFFVLGTMVKSNPEILKREAEEGHYIANHGYSHIYKNIYKNETAPLEEYKKTNELIQDALKNPNYESNVFRFPGGSVGGYYDKIKKKAKKVFIENNIAYLDWNALTYDADGANTKKKNYGKPKKHLWKSK